MGFIHGYYRPALALVPGAAAHYRARLDRRIYPSVGIALVPVLGSSLFPKADATHFLVMVDTPNGSSLAETDRALRFAEDKVQDLPGVQNWFTNLGHGNPQIYYNHIVRQDSANYRRNHGAAEGIRHAPHAARP